MQTRNTHQPSSGDKGAPHYPSEAYVQRLEASLNIYKVMLAAANQLCDVANTNCEFYIDRCDKLEKQLSAKATGTDGSPVLFSHLKIVR